MENLKPIQTLDRRFIKYCITIGELPSSYIESMTYYEALTYLVNYLEKTVIPTLNNNAEVVTELQTLYIELKKYVDNYLNDENLQSLIDKKLDEMVIDGTFDNIIGKYINSLFTRTFDTYENFSKDESLVPGNYVKTLGYHKINDGGGAWYYIRNQKTSTINLFNKYNATVINGFVNSETGKLTSPTNGQESVLLNILPNTTYTISGININSNIGLFIESPLVNISSASSKYQINKNGNISITTGENDHYLVILFSSFTTISTYNTLQVEVGNEVNNYEEPIDTSNPFTTLLKNGYVGEIIVSHPNVKQFGAYGNNINNDSNAFNKAIQYGYLNNKCIFVPHGEYLINGLNIFTPNLKITGENCRLSVLNYSNTSTLGNVINMYNMGCINARIANLGINGNSLYTNGIRCYADINIPDTYTIIENNRIYNCENNGILIDGSYSNTNIREIRINNNEILNNKNGLYANSIADSFIFENSSHANNENGFFFKGGNIKIISNKSFLNGKGDETTKEELKRIPISSFRETTDTTPNPSKIYYIRIGKGIEDNPYIMELFTGSSFEEGTKYYELYGNYFKRYPGYNIQCVSSLISNCEAQDNFGDGFYINNKSNILNDILGDGNGRLEINGKLVKYSDYDLIQLYDGVYCDTITSCIINGSFKNFRYGTTINDKYQRSAVCLYNSVNINVNVISENQITNITNIESPSCRVIYNNQQMWYYFDLDKIIKNETYNYYIGPNNNECFYRQFGNEYELNLILTFENNLDNSNTYHNLLKLPNITTYRQNFYGYPTQNYGNEIQGYVSTVLSNNGIIGYRGNNSYQSCKQLIINTKFTNGVQETE